MSSLSAADTQIRRRIIMRLAQGITTLAIGVLLGSAAGRELSAQSSKPAKQSAAGAPAPVCPLLSVAEVRKITGQDNYVRPWEVGPGEGIGGGSACVYEGPVNAAYGEGPPPIGFTLISGQNWTQGRRKVKLLPGCKHEPLKGVGDDAFFESCPSKSAKKRTDPLYVKVGSNDLIIDMHVKPPATEASSRPTVVAFAKALAAKVR
jgi:hypothetical protein